MNKKVLVTHGWCRNSYAVLRNLGRNNLEVYAGGPSRLSMSGASKYCRKSFQYPSFYTKPETFIESVIKFIKDNDIGTYIPIHEEIFVAAKYRKKFPKGVVVPISDYDAIYTLYNKATSMVLAENLGVPIPKTFRLNNLNDLNYIAQEVIFPAVIKPQHSNGAKGIRFVNSKEELLKEYPEVIRAFRTKHLPIIQEYVEGVMYGVTLLFHNGKSIAESVYKKIREKQSGYGSGFGTATKCQSADAPQLIGYAKKILTKLNYTGIVVFEFKVDESGGKKWLIEANPRYGGAVSHDIDCGIEFPYYQYCMGNGIDFTAKNGCEKGVKSRWIIGDMISLFNSHGKAKNKLKNLKEYLKLDDNYFMDFKLDDPLPFFVESLYYLTRFLKYRSTNPVEEGMIE